MASFFMPVETEKGKIGNHCGACPQLFFGQEQGGSDGSPISGHLYDEIKPLLDILAIDGQFYEPLRNMELVMGLDGRINASCYPIVSPSGEVVDLVARIPDDIDITRTCFNGSQAEMTNLFENRSTEVTEHLTLAEHASSMVFMFDVATNDWYLLFVEKDIPGKYSPDLPGGGSDKQTNVKNTEFFAILELLEEFGIEREGVVKSVITPRMLNCANCMLNGLVDDLRNARGSDGHLFLENYPDKHKYIVATPFSGPDNLNYEGYPNDGVFLIPQHRSNYNRVEVGIPMMMIINSERDHFTDRELDCTSPPGDVLNRRFMGVPLRQLTQMNADTRQIETLILANANDKNPRAAYIGNYRLNYKYPLFDGLFAYPNRLKLLLDYFYPAADQFLQDNLHHLVH